MNYLGMEELELDSRGRALIAGNEVAEFAEDVRAHLDHILVTRRRLKGLSSFIQTTKLLLFTFKKKVNKKLAEVPQRQSWRRNLERRPG